MSFPATYSGWGHLGQDATTSGTMTRAASRARQLATGLFPGITVQQRPQVSKPTQLTTFRTPYADEPGAAPEVAYNKNGELVVGPPSPFMNLLPLGIGLLVLGGGAYALTRKR